MTRILLVEDDAFLRDGLCEMLEKESYSVTPVSTITDARREVAGGFNLVILDVM